VQQTFDNFQSDSLADALEWFNRKERNHVIRALLGHEQRPPSYAKTFVTS